MQTIDDLVTLFHPDSVSITNPKLWELPTPGSAEVRSFEVDYNNGKIIMRITIK